MTGVQTCALPILDAQDILWRRTKLGLFTTAEEQAHLSQYMATLDLKHRKVHAA